MFGSCCRRSRTRLGSDRVSFGVTSQGFRAMRASGPIAAAFVLQVVLAVGSVVCSAACEKREVRLRFHFAIHHCVAPSMDRCEIAGVAVEVPLLALALCRCADHIGSAEIVRSIGKAPRQTACDNHNRIDGPALEKLPESLWPGICVIQRKVKRCRMSKSVFAYNCCRMLP